MGTLLVQLIAMCVVQHMFGIYTVVVCHSNAVLVPCVLQCLHYTV